MGVSEEYARRTDQKDTDPSYGLRAGIFWLFFNTRANPAVFEGETGCAEGVAADDPAASGHPE